MTPLRVVGTGQSEREAAIGVLRRFSDRNLTLADAAGLHLMQTRNTEACWSTDRHLSLTGVPLVIHRY